MNIKLILFSLLVSSEMLVFAQEKCGTNTLLNERIKKDPSLKEKYEKSEKETQKWIEQHGRNKRTKPTENQDTKKGNKPRPKSLCGYDNSYFTTIAAPTTLNQVITTNPNCTYGGEYITVNNLVAGNIYRISTCGVDNFDTQLSVYEEGGADMVAFNDDWCGTQSEILFNPIFDGNYDVLIDAFDCVDNQLCAVFEIELIYKPRDVITIPVVVHVIHNGEPVGTQTNLSDEDIYSQIDILNEDFRRLNADILDTPGEFRGVSDDPLIEFCLAQQDEFGNATDGIDRIQGPISEYTVAQMEAAVKPNSIWEPTKYLNIWTCNLNGDLLGYALPPMYLQSSPQTDGVVIRYKSFGDISAIAPYDMGRTTSHEVGHWLNLEHIWGDEPACAVDDLVDDTPLQATETGTGLPQFPLNDACSPNYPGIMFCNFMDYSDDNVLTMFTVGQAARMDAALFNERVGLLTSEGCQAPSSGINEEKLLNAVTISPNPSDGVFTIKVSPQYKAAQLTVQDIVGRTVYSQATESTQTTIDLSSFPAGIYTLSVKSHNQTVSKKIVVQ
jgi:hypothetical protein